MHINCPRSLAFFWGEKTFRLNKPTASSVAFSLCGQSFQVVGNQGPFLRCFLVTIKPWMMVFVGLGIFCWWNPKWNMTDGRGLVGEFVWLVAWLFWLVGSSTTSRTTKKKKCNQEQRRTIYDVLKIDLEWCHFLRVLICCWLGTVDDTGSAVDKLSSYSTCSPEQNTYRQYKVGP